MERRENAGKRSESCAEVKSEAEVMDARHRDAGKQNQVMEGATDVDGKSSAAKGQLW